MGTVFASTSWCDYQISSGATNKLRHTLDRLARSWLTGYLRNGIFDVVDITYVRSIAVKIPKGIYLSQQVQVEEKKMKLISYETHTLLPVAARLKLKLRNAKRWD